MKRVKLTQGKFVKVTDEDYKFLNQWDWQYCKMGNSACRTGLDDNGKRYRISMSRVVNNTPDKYRTKYINGDTLDCQRHNLKTASKSQINMGRKKTKRPKTSIYKGVNWCSTHKVWISRIWFDNKSHSLGTFHNETEAAQAYDNAALKYFKEFSEINFPQEVGV